MSQTSVKAPLASSDWSPDGVFHVRITFRPGTGLAPALITVHDNVFAYVYVYKGSAAVPPNDEALS